MEALRQASLADLEAVPGIPAALAQKILEFLQNNEGDRSVSEESPSSPV
jgi:DNA uptake protein ComE-like DNA-binding protein